MYMIDTVIKLSRLMVMFKFTFVLVFMLALGSIAKTIPN